VNDKPKIVCSNSASKWPRFSIESNNQIANDSVVVIATGQMELLGLLNSRVLWFVLSFIASPSAPREGYLRYQPKKQFIERLPIPNLTAQQESDLATIAEEITDLSRSRYALHEEVRVQMRDAFTGGEEIGTRISLYEWWELDGIDALVEEIRKRYKVKFPATKQGEWARLLDAKKAEHQALTQQIIALEIRLNDIVYDAFDLTEEERQLIEETTKYPYGAV
jgi:hypothetical protein